MAALLFFCFLLIGALVALVLRVLQLQKQRLSMAELELLLAPSSTKRISTIAVLGSGNQDFACHVHSTMAKS